MNEMRKKSECSYLTGPGTTVDYGSAAPAEVFRRVFTAEGIHLTREEINKPMGLEKKAHIRALWDANQAAASGKPFTAADWTEEDVERLYQAFEAELFQVVAEYSAPIAGVVETVEQLRSQGLKIGSTHRIQFPHDGTGHSQSPPAGL